MRKWISILALCVFTTSIWAGIALAQKDQNANGSFKGKHFNQSQDQRFKDVDQDWAREDIEKASKKGFVKGYEDGTFQPNKPVSSLETLVILVRAAGLEEQVEDYELSNQDLRSLKKIPYWAKAYVAVALEEGILLEEEIKTFNPNQGAKRYQVCIYMQKVLDKFNINPEDDDFMESFIDNHLFPLEAHKSIKNLARLGVVNGYPDGSFAPTRVVKRNEMARMINYLDKNCIQNSEAYVLNGTLSEADLKNQVLYLSVIDNKDKKWNFTVEEDDEILLYYGRQQLEFDDWDRIEAGGDVRVLLDKEQEAIWIKVAPPEEEADYLLFKGILEKVDLDDEELNLNIVDSKNKEWNFSL
ncbi:MAG: S-layer homology domain-containing protein, partial [Syntrophomonadaceae bacterium]|nr:S-layer homology domain-containing protein [Syntrophomonadaceae bacterium]